MNMKTVSLHQSTVRIECYIDVASSTLTHPHYLAYLFPLFCLSTEFLIMVCIWTKHHSRMPLSTYQCIHMSPQTIYIYEYVFKFAHSLLYRVISSNKRIFQSGLYTPGSICLVMKDLSPKWHQPVKKLKEFEGKAYFGHTI